MDGKWGNGGTSISAQHNFRSDLSTFVIPRSTATRNLCNLHFLHLRYQTYRSNRLGATGVNVMAIRSLDELSSALVRDTNLQNQFKTDPVQAIQTVAGQAAIPDTLVYRIVISTRRRAPGCDRWLYPRC